MRCGYCDDEMTDDTIVDHTGQACVKRLRADLSAARDDLKEMTTQRDLWKAREPYAGPGQDWRAIVAGIMVGDILPPVFAKEIHALESALSDEQRKVRVALLMVKKQVECHAVEVEEAYREGFCEDLVGPPDPRETDDAWLKSKAKAALEASHD